MSNIKEPTKITNLMLKMFSKLFFYLQFQLSRQQAKVLPFETLFSNFFFYCNKNKKKQINFILTILKS